MKSSAMKGSASVSVTEALQSVFGFDTFRPRQEEIVRSILDGKDVFAVMPTGGGKSLCYQLPAKMMEGTAVVISPLIALMKDQVDGALENDIAAAFLNSSLNSGQMAGVYERLRNGSLDILYISPERFAMTGFVETLRSVSISFFAIDEAHCVSEWGHDFRPDYLGLSALPRLFPDTPVSAFTATATQFVQDDIIRRLGLRSPFLVRSSFDRPNLFYEVKQKDKVDAQILHFLAEHRGEAGIVYRTTRDAVMRTADFLKSKGVRALPYHAGLAQTERDRNQEAFNRDEAEIIVATIAFGMGIDKSNVRFVIHADLPKNLEGYYQETGRGGRDGEPAHCLLFYSWADVPKILHFIEQIPDDRERQNARTKLDGMVEFAARYGCRRLRLLAYFGERYIAGAAQGCGACDVCTGRVATADATRDAQIVLSAVIRTGERFGAGHVIDVITGSSGQRIRELGHDRIKTFGIGKDQAKGHWRFIIGELLARSALAQEGDPYPILKPTEKCLDILQGREQFTIIKKTESRKKATTLPAQPSFDRGLFERLRVLRKTLADAHGLPPYVVFTDRTLHEMADTRPRNLGQMRSISGIGDAKLERYGQIFLDSVLEYMRENP